MNPSQSDDNLSQPSAKIELIGDTEETGEERSCGWKPECASLASR